MYKFRISAVAAVLICGAGCRDAAGPFDLASANSSISHSTGARDLDSQLGQVAHAIALAMRRPEVRAHVRNSMRASPWTEHKLELLEYLESPAGKHLLRAAAAGADVTPAAFLDNVRQLPALDFYAPFREARIRWRGGAEVLVGATSDIKRNSLVAYRTDGTAVVLQQTDGIPAQPLLIIHLAEAKGLRDRPQAEVAGDAIQDFGDGEISIMNIDGGDTDIPTCDEAGGCGPDYQNGSPPAADTTFIDAVQQHGWGDGWGGSSEIEFRGKLMDSANGVLAEGRRRITGIYKEVVYYPHVRLMAAELPATGSYRIEIQVWETDVWDDDFEGKRDFFYADRGQPLPINNGEEFRHNGVDKAAATFLELDWFL